MNRNNINKEFECLRRIKDLAIGYLESRNGKVDYIIIDKNGVSTFDKQGNVMKQIIIPKVIELEAEI